MRVAQGLPLLCVQTPARLAAALPVRSLRQLHLQENMGKDGNSYVAAGSGLCKIANTLYVVADDELHLGIFPGQGSALGSIHRLFPGSLPKDAKARKAKKPDLESIVYLAPQVLPPHGALLALGSGSRPNRDLAALVKKQGNGDLGPAQTLNLQPLYDALRAKFAHLNIEGAAMVGDKFYLAQRGNSAARDNAIVEIDLAKFISGFKDKNALRDCVLAIHRYELGFLAGVPLSFTDLCALPDGSLAFSAAGEKTQSPYCDGPVSGSVVGVLIPGAAIQALHPLKGGHKVEGVCVLSSKQWLLVTDADDRAIPSELLSVTLP